jgi:hypothetical protein
MTTFKGPLKTYGATKDAPLSDAGSVVSCQTVKLQAATAATVEANIVIPPQSQIIDIKIYNQVLWTATTAGLTIGTASAGTQIMASLDVKANGGKSVGAMTLAQTATAEAFVTNLTPTTLYVTVTSTGANAVGTTRVTVEYAML